jgi:hypothetical protein
MTSKIVPDAFRSSFATGVTCQQLPANPSRLFRLNSPTIYASRLLRTLDTEQICAHTCNGFVFASPICLRTSLKHLNESCLGTVVYAVKLYWLQACQGRQNAALIPTLKAGPTKARSEIVMTSKRKASTAAPVVEEPVDPADELMFLCLGGGNEVGRSCHIIQYKGKTVMVS